MSNIGEIQRMLAAAADGEEINKEEFKAVFSAGAAESKALFNTLAYLGYDDGEADKFNEEENKKLLERLKETNRKLEEAMAEDEKDVVEIKEEILNEDLKRIDDFANRLMLEDKDEKEEDEEEEEEDFSALHRMNDAAKEMMEESTQYYAKLREENKNAEEETPAEEHYARVMAAEEDERVPDVLHFVEDVADHQFIRTNDISRIRNCDERLYICYGNNGDEFCVGYSSTEKAAKKVQDLVKIMQWTVYEL